MARAPFAPPRNIPHGTHTSSGSSGLVRVFSIFFVLPDKRNGARSSWSRYKTCLHFREHPIFEYHRMFGWALRPTFMPPVFDRCVVASLQRGSGHRYTEGHGGTVGRTLPTSRLLAAPVYEIMIFRCDGQALCDTTIMLLFL